MQKIYKDESVTLIQGDCLEVMDKMIEKGLKFDAIITDPPYGTTACKWDSVIPFGDMWTRLNKLINDDTNIIFTSSQPFTSNLIMSNPEMFKYEVIWKKERPTNFMMAKKQIMKYHENILIFYKKQGTYNPQMEKRKEENKRNNKPRGLENQVWNVEDAGKYAERVLTGSNDYIYPNSVLEFSMERGLHPTQKPVKLMEYLINTYTKENDLILDFTCGSGSTLIASKNANRKCIGIELDEKYCEIAKNRILETLKNQHS